jgi:hypothetical protein
MVKKSRRNRSASHFVSFLTLPLIAVNLFVCWKISEINTNLALQIFGSVVNGLSQLIVIIMLNTVALTILIITRE